MKPEDYIFIIIAGYCLSAIIIWFVNLYLKIRLFRKSYEIIDTNETFSLDSVHGALQKQKEMGDLDIKIYSSALPQMIFLNEATIPNQVFERSTVLISTRLFSDPFSPTDRGGIIGFLIYQILKIKYGERIQTRKITFWQALFLLISLDILILIIAAIVLTPIYTIKVPVVFWLFGNFLLIVRNGWNEVKLIHEADNFAFNLTKEYPEILQKYSKVLAKERSWVQKVWIILLTLTWVKPHVAVAKRLQQLKPLQETIQCPQCSEKLLITQSWCPNCHLKVHDTFSYLRYLLWSSIVSFGLTVIPVIIPELEWSSNNILLFLLYSYFGVFILALGTERIHFQKLLPKKPRSVLLTLLLGLVLTLDMGILFIIVEGLNPINKVSLQNSSAIFLTGYIMGGFILYFLVVEYRFKRSTLQWSFPRCPRCSQIISKQVSSCPSCKTQLSTNTQIELRESPELKMETRDGIDRMKYCPKCGQERIETGKFCISCGYSFSTTGNDEELH